MSKPKTTFYLCITILHWLKKDGVKKEHLKVIIRLFLESRYDCDLSEDYTGASYGHYIYNFYREWNNFIELNSISKIQKFIKKEYETFIFNPRRIKK